MHPSDFSWALSMLRQTPGQKMYRRGWNASGQWVVYQPGYPDGIPINKNTANATGISEGTICKFRPYLMLFTAQGDFVPWVPSMGDLLADDWDVSQA